LNKRWGFFYVDNIAEVKYNSQAFKNLVLPRETKEMIYSLVKIHATDGLQFDDLIKGKGKGIVFLLHGPPGVGKTLTAGKILHKRQSWHYINTTAESVADGTRRPLYTISSGDLGTDTNLVESKLSYALALATSWNAVVLIDEADVFLEERRLQDLKRNGLVSGKLSSWGRMDDNKPI
jgi:SpoVK/Ycf46/Vps4 family AAA+-type ATPase